MYPLYVQDGLAEQDVGRLGHGQALGPCMKFDGAMDIETYLKVRLLFPAQSIPIHNPIGVGLKVGTSLKYATFVPLFCHFGTQMCHFFAIFQP